MDWFSWLARSALEPTLAYEYALLFARHELEEEDIVYLNHEFLQSMGIGIAKHRLEILKLAKREKGRAPYVQRLFASLKKTNRKMKAFLQSLLHGHHTNESQSLVACNMRKNPSKGRWFLGCFSPPFAGKKSKYVVGCRDGQRQQSCKRSPLLLKAGQEGGTPLHEKQILPADFGTIVCWESMFEDLKPT